MSEGAKRRRSFPEAFKREAVAAVRGGRSVSQVAAEPDHGLEFLCDDRLGGVGAQPRRWKVEQ